MKYVKLVPLAVSIAMLITPVYMTFVPSYYVSASLQDSAFSQSYNKGNLNLALDKKVFQRGIEN